MMFNSLESWVCSCVQAGNLLTPEMLLSMARDPLVFACANPMPEIDPDVAVATRSDVIIATGRSDFPNQINNVCAFPYIFRWDTAVAVSSMFWCIIQPMQQQSLSKSDSSLLSQSCQAPGQAGKSPARDA